MVLGINLPNGYQITHRNGSNIKAPFPDIPLEMHELFDGDSGDLNKSYRGQFGFIPFDSSLRLPRHVHIGPPDKDGKKMLVTERILVLNGVALVELSGIVYVVAPGSLVTICAGVPHTWTACPAGVKLPDGQVSDGTFLMVYEYEEVTGFFPTKQTDTLTSADQYIRYEGDLEEIRFPNLTKEEVVGNASIFWDRQITDLEP
jgi:hypothetical protein